MHSVKEKIEFVHEGDVDVVNRSVSWQTGHSQSRLADVLAQRLIYTAEHVCKDLQLHRFNQIVWVEGSPWVTPCTVEAIDRNRAWFTTGELLPFQPTTVFGPVPFHVFEKSEQVFLLSDANPSLFPGPQVVYANQAFEKMTGFASHEIIGKTPRILHGEKTDPGRRAEIRSALKRWQPIQVEVLNYHKNGTPFNVHLDISPVTDSLGWYEFWFAIQRDTTEEQRKQDELVSLARAAGIAEGATNALHNIGNVLNSVLLSTRQIQEGLSNSSLVTLQKMNDLINEHPKGFVDFVANDPRGKKVPKLISVIAEHSKDQLAEFEQELMNIVNHVHHISAIVSGTNDRLHSRSNLEDVSVNGLIENALAICKCHYETRGITVENYVQTDLPSIKTNQHQVIQVLVNLIKNASEALEEAEIQEPVIWVKAEFNSEQVSLQVRDNGCGIESDQLEKIFEHGYSTKSNGNGFGLHSCFTTANALGGELIAQSEGKGKGAIFEMRLPR